MKDKKTKSPYHNYSMWKGARPGTFSKARELRKNLTVAEQILWDVLNKKPYRKYKFRRQHPLGHYILDFYSHSLKLAIEVDGGYHTKLDQKEYDRIRTEFVQFQNVHELRFSNEEVENNIEEVLFEISRFIGSNSPDTL